jgi:hypothetical protein
LAEGTPHGLGMERRGRGIPGRSFAGIQCLSQLSVVGS